MHRNARLTAGRALVVFGLFLSLASVLASGARSTSALSVTATGGRVVAWGGNDEGQTAVPVGLGDVVAVDGGWGHTVALRSNGKVVTWGDDETGPVPPSLSGVVDVSAGCHYSLALRRDGRVVAWGNHGPVDSFPSTGVTGATAISAGCGHALAVRRNGTVLEWPASQVPAGLTNVVAVAGGYGHSLALRSDGTVVAWLWGDWGDYGEANVPAGLTDVVAIDAGWHRSIALRRDGTVVSWGCCGDTTPPAGLTGVVAVAAGGGYFALKADGTVVTWGASGSPDSVPPLRHVSAIGAGLQHVAAIVNDDLVLVTGNTGRMPAADRPLVERLTAAGWAVTAVDDDTLATTTSKNRLALADVVVVSSSVNVSLSTYGSVLKPLPVPLVLLEPFLAKPLGLAPGGSSGEIAGQKSTQIRSGHPLAGGLAIGTHRVTTSTTTFGWYRPVPSATIVATRPGTAQAEIFGIETGHALTSGIAPARRVGFFYTYATPPLANTTGWTLFNAAVDWAAGLS
jgi:alpha-tubulin suppressor-like RCC1 family protein